MKTEQEMREAKVPMVSSQSELTDYIEGLVNREHDYGTCVYAMSMAAVAAFEYVAGKLGVTGFQASCADMDILRRTRMLKGPFMLINGNDALYPQYDLQAKLQGFLDDIKPWLAEQAAKEIEGADKYVHPNVMAHWKRLAAQEGKS